jgi:hypothetical protein
MHKTQFFLRKCINRLTAKSLVTNISQTQIAKELIVYKMECLNKRQRMGGEDEYELEGDELALLWSDLLSAEEEEEEVSDRGVEETVCAGTAEEEEVEVDFREFFNMDLYEATDKVLSMKDRTGEEFREAFLGFLELLREETIWFCKRPEDLGAWKELLAYAPAGEEVGEWLELVEERLVDLQEVAQVVAKTQVQHEWESDSWESNSSDDEDYESYDEGEPMMWGDFAGNVFYANYP